MVRFGSSGLRGVFGDVGPREALSMGMALASMYGDVASCRDARSTSLLMQLALEAGVMAAGGDALRLGLAPTPVASFAAKEFGLASVSVTASHNPPEYAGLKPFSPGGAPLYGVELERLSRLMEEGVEPVSWSDVGVPYEVDVLDGYLDAVSRGVDSLEGLRVVVDCGNGATSVTAPAAFKMLGASVVTLNCEPSPQFNRDPEPGPGSLTELRELVRATGAHMGAAFDPDGDRFVAVDPRGRVIMGAEMAYILGKLLGAREMVVSVDSPSYLDREFEVFRTRVGDVFVTKEMMERGIKFGFEPSGTQILADHLPTPDGLRAAIVLASHLRERPLDALLDSVPRWGYARASLPLRDRSRLERFLEGVEGAISRIDGVRLRDGNVFVLIRPSGTEPKVRIAVDGEDPREVEEKLEKWRGILKGVLG